VRLPVTLSLAAIATLLPHSAVAQTLRITADDRVTVLDRVALDALPQDTATIVPHRHGGAALDSTDGPLRLVLPRDRRQARWVRQLVAIVVREEHAAAAP
jgi:hypothetical protein